MKKKTMVIGLALAVMLTTAACKDKTEETNTASVGSEPESTEEVDSSIVTLSEFGFEFRQPEFWNELDYEFKLNTTILGESEDSVGGFIVDYWPAEVMEYIEKNIPKDESQELSEEETAKFIEDMAKMSKPVMQVMGYQKELIDEIKIADLTEFINNEKIGEKDNIVYYISYVKPEVEGLNDEEKAEFLKLLDTVKEIKQTFKTIDRVNPMDALNSEEVFPKFEMSDTAGNMVSEKIFKDYKVTMINIWATTCGPCIQEMPELQSLYADYKDKDFNLIGLVVDGEQNKSDLKTILEKKGVKFTNLMANDSVSSYLKNIAGTPTTIFVDKDGNIIGEPIVGSRSKADYEIAVKELLGK